MQELKAQKKEFPEMAIELNYVHNACCRRKDTLKYREGGIPQFEYGFLNYNDMRQVYNFEPEKIDFNSKWHTGP